MIWTIALAVITFVFIAGFLVVWKGLVVNYRPKP